MGGRGGGGGGPKQRSKMDRGELLGDTLIKHQPGWARWLSQDTVMVLPPLAIVNTLSSGPWQSC